MLITTDYIRSIFYYDEETGNLIRKIKTGPNGKIGIVGTPDKEGYLTVGFNGGYYKVHRLIWFYKTGTWPRQIDHRDKNKSNNRWSNLREATSSQNAMNKPLKATNTSGVRGVVQDKRNGKWRAYVSVKEKLIWFGPFATKEQAINVRFSAEETYYGEFKPS